MGEEAGGRTMDAGRPTRGLARQEMTGATERPQQWKRIPGAKNCRDWVLVAAHIVNEGKVENVLCP